MNRTKQLTETKNRLKEIVARHEKLKNSYFWHPAGHASGRRSNEEKNNDYFENKQLGIIAQNNYSESCKNIYYKGYFCIENTKVTVTKIKNIIAALEEIC